MAFTEYYRDTRSGLTLYAQTLGDRGAATITGVAVSGDTTLYEFASLDDATTYEVFEQSGGSPASSDEAIARIAADGGVTAAEVRSELMGYSITKGTAGSVERVLWQTLKSKASVEGSVVADASNTATTFQTDLTSEDGHYDHQILMLVSGALEGEARPILSTEQSNGRITLQEPLTATPADGDEFLVLPNHVHPVSEIQNGLGTLAKQDQILAKFAGTVTISQPVASTGQITGPLVIGDDYKAINDRAFSWTINAVTGATAAGSTCKLGFSHPTKGSFIVSGTVTDNSDGTWTLTFDVSSSDSASLEPGSYDWSVELTEDATNKITSVRSSDECGRVAWVERQT